MYLVCKNSVIIHRTDDMQEAVRLFIIEGDSLFRQNHDKSFTKIMSKGTR